MAENKKSVEELEALIAQLKAEKSTLLESNQELQTQLEESEQTVKTVMSVVSDGKHKYRLIVKKIQHEGEIYTAADLEKNQKVVAALVAIKSGVLVKI